MGSRFSSLGSASRLYIGLFPIPRAAPQDRGVRRFAVLLVAVLAGLSSLLVTRDVAAAQWGSGYGDP